MWLCARLFLNGAPASGAWRHTGARNGFSCQGCSRTSQKAWKWATIASDDGTNRDIAWCSDCTRGKVHGILLSNASPDDLSLASANHGHYTLLPGSDCLPARGVCEPCPLCSSGEAGSEHLCVFCPAVRHAWAALMPDGPTWWSGVPYGGSDQVDALRIKFTHAVSRLSCVLFKHPVPHATGVRLIMAELAGQTCMHDRPAPLLFPDQDPDDPTFTSTDPDRIAMWALPQSAGPNRCSCNANGYNLVGTWTGPHPARAAMVDGSLQQALLVASAAVPQGRILLQLVSDVTPAHWPLSDNGALGRVLPLVQVPPTLPGRAAGVTLVAITASRFAPLLPCVLGMLYVRPRRRSPSPWVPGTSPHYSCRLTGARVRAGTATRLTGTSSG